ncbi:MAG: hypothetical protein P4L46_08885 [Fimbriimonas sp.]|nr:hypothetical protein [Fimbriimonas sp.]
MNVVLLSAILFLHAQAWSGGDTWSFEPKADDFRSDALLDLRPLNEKRAGESGFITVDKDGSFRLGNGSLERFWAVNTNVGRQKSFQAAPLGRPTAPDLARHARFLAKRGVNMVRFHGQLSPNLEKYPDAAITDVNEDERDWCWRLVASMKKEGIYTTISPYWMVPMKFSKNWNIPGGAGQSAASLLFFDPTLQAGYKSWLKALLTPVNPYTGIPLAKDPALAIIEIQNEDSMLFWNINDVKGPQRANLQRLFATWAKAKYGTSAKVHEAWGGEHLKGDDPADAGYDLYNIWDATQPQFGAKQVRLGDQIQFLTETMRKFNGDIVNYIHNDLGCKQLVNAGNWRTADPIRLNDAERYSYTTTQVDAVNKYFDGIHKGPNNGWAIMNGDLFTSPSVLLDPKPLPTNLKQTVGRPIVITESSWVLPTGYDTEGPFLISAYQSLTGVAGFYWFATGDDEWTQPYSANGYLPSSMKWVMGNPDMLGTFPAAALMYRKGYVKQGSPAVVEERSLADLWARRTPIVSEEPSYDPNRDAGDIASGSNVKTGIDPLAFLVGPVEVEFGGDPSKSKVADLRKYIDRDQKTVKSNTGEIELNFDKGVCTVDTPCAQGVAAFFRSKPMVRTSDVTFLSQNEYGSAVAVSLDGQPLKSSSKVLVQYGTRCRPTGWSDEPASIDLDGGKKAEGFRVVSYGRPPWQVQKAKLDVIIRNPNLRNAEVLDMNGNAITHLTLAKTPDGVRFRFPESAMYVVLQR